MYGDVKVTSFRFSIYTNVHISYSTEPANFIFGTNIQQHNVHKMNKMQVTLTKAEGRRWRLKVT